MKDVIVSANKKTPADVELHKKIELTFSNDVQLEHRDWNKMFLYAFLIFLQIKKIEENS